MRQRRKLDFELENEINGFTEGEFTMLKLLNMKKNSMMKKKYKKVENY
jgi:hypothetical protein